MRVLLWHVHGSWTTAFVHGRHTSLIPVLPDRGPDGLGRARTWDWPPQAEEIAPGTRPEVDLVVLQRPHEEELCRDWFGLRPGRDVPAVYVEHNAPQGRVNEMRHPVAGRPELTVVHVTHFNDLFWDTGATPTRVIEHGIVDPGHRYTGELPRAVATINEPGRRGRVTGTDLLDVFEGRVPVDLFGIDSERAGGLGNLPQEELHTEMARRRVYVHPIRWTSLGLSLLEAMHLGMPVVAVATTEAVRAVPPGTGVISTRTEELVEAARHLVEDPEEAGRMGKAAREWALERYGLDRFLADWEDLMTEVCR